MNDQVSKKLDDLLVTVGCDAHPRTIAGVVMWLYDVHGIWINPYPDTHFHLGWYFHISKGSAKTWVSIYHSTADYDSPDAAYEAAIEYTLENLI